MRRVKRSGHETELTSGMVADVVATAKEAGLDVPGDIGKIGAKARRAQIAERAMREATAPPTEIAVLGLAGQMRLPYDEITTVSDWAAALRNGGELGTELRDQRALLTTYHRQERRVTEMRQRATAEIATALDDRVLSEIYEDPAGARTTLKADIQTTNDLDGLARTIKRRPEDYGDLKGGRMMGYDDGERSRARDAARDSLSVGLLRAAAFQTEAEASAERLGAARQDAPLNAGLLRFDAAAERLEDAVAQRLHHKAPARSTEASNDSAPAPSSAPEASRGAPPMRPGRTA